ncbi:MAG: type VI secretion system ATPase TssH, partial [Candidatus Kapaibacterium sp.]
MSANESTVATRKRLEEIERELSELREEYDALKSRWSVEKEHIQSLRSLKEHIEQTKRDAETAERDGDLGKVAELRYGQLHMLTKKLEEEKKQLDASQSAGKMLKEEVGAEDIAEIVARWTGIPVQRMLETERTKLLT